MEALEASLAFTSEQKSRTLLRSDAGFGSDANVNWALNSGWQVLAKGKGGRRPYSYARRVAADDWQAIQGNRWIAPVSTAVEYVRPTQHFVLRWLNQSGEMKYSTVVCSIMTWTPSEIMAHYDDRGACETEIQVDKQGLKLERRRKKNLAAQEALVLLTDVAHNLLAWTARWMALPPPLNGFGPLRLIEDVLSMPGHLIFHDNQLVEVQLNKLHPYAEPVAIGLQHLLTHFDNP